MQRVPISEVTPGQKLARAITSGGGVIMMQPGTELTPPLIERLRTLGIDSVVVAGDLEAPPDGPPLEERLRVLDERFAGHEQDPWMMQLKDIVARQLGARGADSRG
jgi:hypothetical protein